MARIVLGTVQFGVKYGINNTSGQVNQEEVETILKLAKQNDVVTLDTSSAYGTSEQVLGKALKRTGLDFDVVSKYPKSEKGVRDSFKKSLCDLGLDSLYGYLVHHFDFYQEYPGIYDEMHRLKDEGCIKKIGFSIYNPLQLQYLLDRNVQFDIIQFPYNIFDRQFEPWLPILKDAEVEVHTRSAFLQGLFFMNPLAIEGKLKPLCSYLERLHSYCMKRSISVEQLAFGYVLNNENVDGALIGIDNHQQFEKNVEVSKFVLRDEDVDFIHSINIKEKDLLNPVNWK